MVQLAVLLINHFEILLRNHMQALLRNSGSV